MRPDVLSIVWVVLLALLPAAAQAACAWRIRKAGLVGQYPVTVAFLTALAIASSVMTGFWVFTVSAAGNFYGYAYALGWFVHRILYWAFFLFVLLEIARRMLERYEGFRRVGDMTLRFGLTASGLLVLGLWLFVPAEEIGTVRRFWQFQANTVWISLTVVWLVFGALGSFFRLTPPPNVRAVYALLAAVLIGHAALESYLFGPSAMVAQTALSFWNTLCLGVTAAMIRPQGEQAAADRLRAARSAADARRAAERLEAINASLVRLMGRG